MTGFFFAIFIAVTLYIMAAGLEIIPLARVFKMKFITQDAYEVTFSTWPLYRRRTATIFRRDGGHMWRFLDTGRFTPTSLERVVDNLIIAEHARKQLERLEKSEEDT